MRSFIHATYAVLEFRACCKEYLEISKIFPPHSPERYTCIFNIESVSRKTLKHPVCNKMLSNDERLFRDRVIALSGGPL